MGAYIVHGDCSIYYEVVQLLLKYLCIHYFALKIGILPKLHVAIPTCGEFRLLERPVGPLEESIVCEVLEFGFHGTRPCFEISTVQAAHEP